MEDKGIDFASIPQTAIKFITSPALFYREMPRKGGFVEPLVFMVVMGVIGGLIQAVASLLGLNLAGGIAAGVSSIIIVPVAVAIGGFIGAAILFVIWKLMGSQEDYETAYRCGAYASAFTPILTITGLIPYLGIVISMLIWVYLLVVASVEVHQIPSGKAWLVFGIIGAILIVVGVSGQVAAKKLSGQMQEAARQMQDEAGKTAGPQQQVMPLQGDAGQQATQAQTAANQQLEESIRQMEARMGSLPPDQQAQMRQAIEQMRAASSQTGR